MFSTQKYFSVIFLSVFFLLFDASSFASTDQILFLENENPCAADTGPPSNIPFFNIAQYLGMTPAGDSATKTRVVGICTAEQDVEYENSLFESVTFQWLGSSKPSMDKNLELRKHSPTHGTLVVGTLVGASPEHENPATGNWGLCRTYTQIYCGYEHAAEMPGVHIVFFSERIYERDVSTIESLVRAGKIVLIASGNNGFNLDLESNIEFQRLKHLPLIWVGTCDPISNLCGTSTYLTKNQIEEFDAKNGPIFITMPHHVTYPWGDNAYQSVRGCTSVATPVLAALIATFLVENPDFPTKKIPNLLRIAKDVIPVRDIPKDPYYPLEDLLKRSGLTFFTHWLEALRNNCVNEALVTLKSDSDLTLLLGVLPQCALEQAVKKESLCVDEIAAIKVQFEQDFIPELLKSAVGLEYTFEKKDLDEITPLDASLLETHPYAAHRRALSKSIILKDMDSLWTYEADLGKVVSLVRLDDLRKHASVFLGQK